MAFFLWNKHYRLKVDNKWIISFRVSVMHLDHFPENFNNNKIVKNERRQQKQKHV